MEEQVSKNWKVFKEKFIETHKNVPPYILDYIAVEDILLSHLKGYSIEKICEIYQLSEEYVTIVIGDYLRVSPRRVALNFSPYSIYKNEKIDKNKFLNFVKNKLPEEEGEALYDACMLFELVEEQIEEFYKE